MSFKMSFKKGDTVCIKRTCQGYEDLYDDIGFIAVEDSGYGTVGVSMRNHSNLITVHGLYYFHPHELEHTSPKEYLNKRYGNPFSIKDVIFNDPAVIVLWDDGTKTVVKCSENDIFDPEKGLAMAISKKALGNQGNYYETFKKYLPEEQDIDDFGLHPFVSLGKAAARWADDCRDLINNLKKQTSETPEPIHPTVAYEESYPKGESK